MNICGKCAMELRDGVKFCINCGTAVGSQFCSNCGTKVLPEDTFCGECGTSLKNTLSTQNSWTANKRYTVIDKSDPQMNPKHYENCMFQLRSELADEFWLGIYTILDDGTQIGFRYGHNRANKDEGAQDFHYNLYRLNPDGKAYFLGAGLRGNIEEFYVLDGYAYGSYCGNEMKVSIDI